MQPAIGAAISQSRPQTGAGRAFLEADPEKAAEIRARLTNPKLATALAELGRLLSEGYEEASDVLEKCGFPRPGTDIEIWCHIARMIGRDPGPMTAAEIYEWATAAVDMERLKKGIAQPVPDDGEGGVGDELVTLNQVAPLTGLSKRTLERHLREGKLPEPDSRGGGGRAHKWHWRTIRPALGKMTRKALPEHFPGSRIV